MRRSLRWALSVLLLAVLALAWFHYGDRIRLPSEAEISAVLATVGVWGPLAIIGLRGVTALLAVVPSAVIVMAAGAIYGVALGSLYILIGAEIGALIAFLTGAWLGRGYAERHGWLDRLRRTRAGAWLLDETAGQRRLTLAVLYCRLLPGLNFDGMSYVAGVTQIRLWRFLLATLIGLIPYTVLFAAFGEGLMQMDGRQVAMALGLMLALLAIPAFWQFRKHRRRRAAKRAAPLGEEAE
ncbi:VTT domain-containing protein [Methyloligella sp. 2.7D]|uniref:TVP38/TMEM64 family protein n=1 Tax=unclassified Methyloligella TaxID=2625955 RepID=UPI00157D864A|nr:VTT domain-containing protein [Methyloligella sp. GL2]QKP77334.1 TVP38/TMEM64 family protein [Methyloligella sp. GL2]